MLSDDEIVYIGKYSVVGDRKTTYPFIMSE